MKFHEDPDDPNSQGLLPILDASLDLSTSGCTVIGSNATWPQIKDPSRGGGSVRNVTLAYSDDERWAYSDRATALRREPIESACAAAASGANDTALLELDGYYNFCRIMGVVKLKEQPSTTFWRELYRRASLLPRPDGEAVVAARNAGIDSSTVCLQVRGRMKEETGQPLNQSQEVRTVLRLAEQMATRMDAFLLIYCDSV